MKTLLKIVSIVALLLIISGCDQRAHGLVVNDDSAVVTQGQSVEINATANDRYDKDATEHFMHVVLKSIATAPNKGTAVIDDVNNTIIYTANTGESGDDTFVYTAYATGKKEKTGYGLRDYNSTEKNATVTVHITEVDNHKPVANSQTVELDCNQTAGTPSVDIILAGSDADGDTLTYSIVQNPWSGTLSAIDSNNMVTYTLDSNTFCHNGDAKDTFTFKVNDGLQDSDDANITIVPINAY